MNKMKIEIVKDHALWRVLQDYAQKSDCLRRKVSAVLHHHDWTDRKYFTGHMRTNAVADGLKPCKTCYRKDNNIEPGTRYETCRCIHAEQNAIMHSSFCNNATLYVYGHNFICLMCKRAIVEAGIKDVYLRESMDHDVQYFTREDIMKTEGL